MKFRKKPVVIEAMQYTGENYTEIANWAHAGLPDFSNSIVWKFAMGGLGIRTLEGQLRASNGDWIIRGVKGEFYPCKPDIFEATYEPVEEKEPVK